MSRLSSNVISFILGFFAGVFLCISTVEVVHQVVEIGERPEDRMCELIVLKLRERFNQRTVSGVKTVYKFFSFPVREVFQRLELDRDGEYINVYTQD